jgi:pyruvate/2-oxoglutarate/acetoin dehydrogenase E1 component
MKRRNIITNNREVYEKFNNLNFTSEVILKTVKPIQIQKIIHNINKTDKTLHLEKIGDYFLVKRVGPINFNMYFK